MPLKDHVNCIRELAEKINRPVKLMEVCGTHTMAAFRSGLRSLLPQNVTLLSGPGCPVCVTPNEYLDRAIGMAMQHPVSLFTFGDMLRVPGTESSLEMLRAQGADIQVVYSPQDALDKARRESDKKIVFLGVGFETTTPAVAWTLKESVQKKVENFYVLSAHKTIPSAMKALLQGPIKIDGFLCPGHVSVIIGAQAYEFISRDHNIPCVAAGFEAADMVYAIEMLLKQVLNKRAEVEIQYTRSVTHNGNPAAQAILEEVFEECNTEWRGLGNIPGSGLRIRNDYASSDAALVFPVSDLPESKEQKDCLCGEILKGIKTPYDCSLFGKACSPSSPIGACMVSSEGTCAAYHKYSKLDKKK